ncbi:SMP-30/gluconolactonase/LRE family protein [Actinomadura sp. ATCC 31491]|uniref:SMP-30/gluconolactonase/LRE family protein n=1 Tax=Actinomadura luzonensis TaxID=2805427 RepID=A0ABT0FW29_9ACTN|nr:SMP-30/gluconolactonase/LRE family protein [Actinomadura luzonensis]MCK2216136.1 SMP-30/gluconolactonase/LRE family protein [Actinomadura luzonensis]
MRSYFFFDGGIVLMIRMSAVLASAVLAGALAAPPALADAAGPAAAPRTTTAPRVTTAYELPGDRVYPEGITADPRTGVLYAASWADGTVYELTPGRRVAATFLPAGSDGRDTANGLEADDAGRLWVTDSTSGVFVYDTRTRELLARFDVPAGAPSFVNDLAVAPDGAVYVTDSLRAVVYRVTPAQFERARGGAAELTPFAALEAALDPHADGAYTLNGIVTDPSGRYLLTADMTGGDLFRVDLATRAVRRVTLRGGDMLHADGLELRQGTLWAVHNTADTISRWHVAAGGGTATVEKRLTDPALQLPTTLARVKGTLYVVRSQFDRGGPLGDEGAPQIPFTVAAVRGL